MAKKVRIPPHRGSTSTKYVIDPNTLIQQGLALHNQGKLAQAKEIYEAILKKQPKHFDALNLLGAIAAQTRNFGAAVELIGKALKINPGVATAYNNRGNALMELKRLDEALASYDRALALKPDYPRAHNNRGLALAEARRLAEAVGSYDKALALKPDYAEAHYNRGNALMQLKRLDGALASYDRALALKPDYAEACYNRGNALMELKCLDEALAHYDRALALKPDYAEAYNNRGNALMELKRLDEALASYDGALALKPDHAEAYNNRGNALMEFKRLDEALASYDRALALKPDYAEAYNNRGRALTNLERLSEALESLDKALALKPDDADAHNNRGAALKELKRLDEALTSYDCALALEPGHAGAHYNRGNALIMLKRLDEALGSLDKALALKPGFSEAACSKSACLLLDGCFEDGWPLYESRKNVAVYAGHFSSRSFAQDLWSGDASLSGKTLFIHWEQGLGDTIQFCRFAKLAEQRGAKVVFSAQNRLRRLLQTLSPAIEIIDENQAPAEFDCYCPLLSLPLAFRTTSDNIPEDAPYLRAEPDRVCMWRDKIGGEGFKIGIAWQGSTNDDGRSFAPEEFMGVSRIPNVRLISLQKGSGQEQLQALPGGMEVESLGEDFDAGDNAFLDAAAVMENLDLVITADTSVAHLAGALARPVWVALKHVPEWRWMLDRIDSPWYPTMRLFRQPARGDWRGVFSEIENGLLQLTRAKREEKTGTPAPDPGNRR